MNHPHISTRLSLSLAAIRSMLLHNLLPPQIAVTMEESWIDEQA